MSVRKFATLLLQTTWAGNGLLPAPVVVALAGGGSLAAGNYNTVYSYESSPQQFVSSGIAGRITNPSAASGAVAANLNDRLQIDIFPNNLGEGVGQGTDGCDDPFNGFCPSKTTNTMFGIPLVKKGADPNFTTQLPFPFFSWSSSARCQRGILSAYITGVTFPTAEGFFPLRFILWNPSIQAMIGITVDKAILFAGDFSSFTRFGIANDKAGNAHFWSRLPTQMRAAYLEQIPIISDNLSRPKRMHWTGSAATSNFRLLGANVPAAVPTAVVNVAAGNLNGNYFYKVAYVFRDARGDLTTLDIESNATATSTVVAPANQKADVTIPGTSETGLQFRRVYRTKAGGTVFFFHSDQAAGTGNLTFTDNTADSGLGVDTPVNDVGKDPNDVPPNKLAYLTSHKGRLFALESNYLVDSQNRIIDFIATNRLRLTKAAALGTSEAINAWPSTFPVFICGDASPPTGLISHRGTLYFFKANAIGQVAGNDETDLTADVVFQGVGAMRNSIIAVGSLIFFWEDARGPMTFNGVSYDPIGYDIQPTWDVDRDAGYYVNTCWFDPIRQEIHWEVTNLNIAPGAAAGVGLVYKEYVLYIPTKAWTQYDSPDTQATVVDIRSINASDRAVLSADIGRQVYSQVIATKTGLALQEGGTGSIYDGAGSNPISCTFKVFFGDTWESVKTNRCIEIMSVIGSAITVQMALLNNQTFVTVATLTVDANRSGDRIDLVDIPQETFQDPTSTYTIAQDRGIALRLVFAVANQPTTTKVRGVSLKYKEASDMRRAP